MNFQELKINILAVMLDTHSTTYLSKQLGFGFNKVQRWRVGSKQCRWEEFWGLCLKLELPIASALEHVFLFNSKNSDLRSKEPQEFIIYLRKLHGHQPITFLAEKINVHVSVLKRYFRGDTSPDLDVVFALMDLNENALASFLIRLLGRDKIQNLKMVEKKVEQKEIENRWPAALAVKTCLNLQGYQSLDTHSDVFISDVTGVPVEEVHSVLNELIKCGNIFQKDGKYFLNELSVAKASINEETRAQAVNYWTNKALLRFLSEDKPLAAKSDVSSLAAYYVVAASEQASKKMTELLIRTQNEIRDLLAADTAPATDIRVVLTHHFSIQDRP